MEKFEAFEFNGQPITNEMECPLMESNGRFDVILSTCILGCISLIHECETLCTYTSHRKIMIEREEVTISKKGFEHSGRNNMYAVNIYCMNYYSVLTQQ